MDLHTQRAPGFFVAVIACLGTACGDAPVVEPRGSDAAGDVVRLDGVARPERPASAELGTEIVATGQLQPWAIVAGTTGVYWVNRGNGSYGTGSVARSVTGAEPTQLAAAQDFPTALALDDGGVTWASYGAYEGGVLFRTSLNGSGFMPVADEIGHLGGMVVASGRAYWTNTAVGTVESVKLNGEGWRIVAEHQQDLGTIAAEGNRLFWTAGKALWQAQVPGIEVDVLWAGETVSAVASGDGRVAWATSGGDVMTADCEHGTGALLASFPALEGATAPVLAVDASGVYLGGAEGVAHVGFDGEVDAVSGQAATAIALDASHVYWVDAAAGTVLRARKPVAKSAERPRSR